MVAAQGLSTEVGSALVGAARAAFLRGLVASEVISGVGTLLLAVFAWVTFRSVEAPQRSLAARACRALRSG